MTFYSIVEKWCETYKYMRHNVKNGNIRFMFTDSYKGVVEMAKNINSMRSPCVVMESTIEGDGPLRRPVFNYAVYFFVQAGMMSDGTEAAAAKQKALQHARNFLAWLLQKHDEEVKSSKLDGDYARIDLDDVNVSYQSVGALENGWFGVLIQLQREEPLNLCVNDDLYN